jgi:hypothetical protein
MSSATAFELDKSTLEDMHLEITERLFPFITFNILDDNGVLVASNTIPWARFREVEDRPDLWEVRSNDDPVVTRHVLYLSQKVLSSYIFTQQNGPTHYVFTYYIGLV